MTNNYKIKIVHLVESLHLGSTERFLEYTENHYNQSRFDLEIWCLKHEGETAERLKRKGVTVKLYEFSNSCHDKESQEKLAALFCQSNIDILHTHSYYANTIGRYAAKKSKIPVITHLHDENWDYTLKHVFHEWILSFSTYKIICASKSLIKFAQKYQKISHKKLTMIHSGIDVETFDKDEAFRPISKSYKLKDDDKVLICTAPLNEYSGHKFLINAMETLVSQSSTIKCMIISDGPEKQNLIEITQEKNLTENVLFIGERDDIPFFLRHADLFVLPSLTAGFPISILEAMAACLPIVATKVGGIPELISNGVNGLLVPPKNPEALVLAINHLLDDNSKRSKFAHNGRVLVEETLKFETTQKQIENLYTEIYHKKK